MKKFALLLSLLPAVAQAQNNEHWWVGTWAYDAAWCAAKNQIGAVTPAPIAITPTQTFGYENSCTITEILQMTTSTVRMSLSCQGEGESYFEEWVILRGDGAIWLWFGVDEPLKFTSCG